MFRGSPAEQRDENDGERQEANGEPAGGRKTRREVQSATEAKAHRASLCRTGWLVIWFAAVDDGEAPRWIGDHHRLQRRERRRRRGTSSSISPVAIFAALIAAPITSAGRFWPCGPLGIGLLFLGALDAPLLAGNLPFGISPNAGALLVGLREASLGLRDYLAGRGGWLMVSLLAVGHA
jgi:hypothetical protein